jgi:hypothetical protein
MLIHQVSAAMAAWDPAALSPEDMSTAVLDLLAEVRDIVDRGGEQAYMARRSGLFLLENLSLALRRDRHEFDVPHEHAALLDAAYDKVRAITTGVIPDTEPDTTRLNGIEETQKQFLKMALEESGLVAKVPTGSPKKIIT